MAALGRLAEGTAQAESLLAGEAGDVATALGRAQGLIRQLATLDPALADTERLLDEATIACREAVAGLRRYADGLEADPVRQEWVESRLAALEFREIDGTRAERREFCGEFPVQFGQALDVAAMLAGCRFEGRKP